MMTDEVERPEEGQAEPKRDRRGQRTIKHEKMTDELWALCQRAAKRLGVGVNEWVCDTIQREAERELGMEPPPPTREALALILKRLDEREGAAPAPPPPTQEGEAKPEPRPGVLGRIFGGKKDMD